MIKICPSCLGLNGGKLVGVHEDLLKRFRFFERTLISEDFNDSKGTEMEGGGVCHVMQEMSVGVMEVIAHLMYGCGDSCSTISDQLRDVMASPDEAVDLLFFMEYLAGENIAEFRLRLLSMANQMELNSSKYLALLKLLGPMPGTDSLCRQWNDHLFGIVFHSTKVEKEGNALVDLLAADESVFDAVIEHWTAIFLHYFGTDPVTSSGINRHYPSPSEEFIIHVYFVKFIFN